MKERIFYDDDDFERQLKSKADQFKMYPSDKVWNEVNRTLHSRRRKFVVGMSALIGGFLILAGSLLITPVKNNLPRTIVAKSEPAVKPQADLQKLTESNFTAAINEKAAENSGKTDRPERIPFLNAGASDVSDETINLIPVTASAVKVRTTTPDLNIPVNAKIPLSVPAVDETSWAVSENQASHIAAAEPVAEKSLVRAGGQFHNERFSWEIYIAPTVNNRTLTGFDYQAMNQSVRQQAPIMLVGISNVNGFLDNTPLVGYDVGGNLFYKLSKKISIKAGLAFSYNRYYIKAYNSSPSQLVPQLNSYLGYISDTTVATVGNPFSAHKNTEHVQNRYYQLSMPVGLDYVVTGEKRLQLHLGATIQPTYLLSTDAYVLSEDFHTYVKDDQAFRKWNFFAGGELYLSYSVGQIRWEVGPQVRYQLLSTYKSSYPLQENMLSYGIRFGISKTIW